MNKVIKQLTCALVAMSAIGGTEVLATWNGTNYVSNSTNYLALGGVDGNGNGATFVEFNGPTSSWTNYYSTGRRIDNGSWDNIDGGSVFNVTHYREFTHWNTAVYDAGISEVDNEYGYGYAEVWQ